MNKNVIFNEDSGQFGLGSDGGGSASPDEMHRVIVQDKSERTITDFKGTICVVRNGLESFNDFTLAWDALDVETEKLTIMFSFDANNITHKSLNGAKINRIPTEVKENDVWVVVYDKFFKNWDLVSCNRVGTNKQVMAFKDGVLTPIALGIEQFSDVGGFPSFDNGLLTATGIDSDKKEALIMFLEFSIGVQKKNTFPMYTNDATLKVADGITDNDAVSMKQYNELLRRIEILEKK